MDLQPTAGLLEENQLVAALLLLLMLLLLILLLLYHDRDKAVSSISHLAACLVTGQGSPRCCLSLTGVPTLTTCVLPWHGCGAHRMLAQILGAD